MKAKSNHKEHVERAVEICGTQQALADQIGKSQGYIWNLLNDAKKVNPRIAIRIETATDGAVTKEQLCPDVFTSEVA